MWVDNSPCTTTPKTSQTYHRRCPVRHESGFTVRLGYLHWVLLFVLVEVHGVTSKRYVVYVFQIYFFLLPKGTTFDTMTVTRGTRRGRTAAIVAALLGGHEIYEVVGFFQRSTIDGGPDGCVSRGDGSQARVRRCGSQSVGRYHILYSMRFSA